MAINLTISAAARSLLVDPANTGTRAIRITHIQLGEGSRVPDGTEVGLVTAVATGDFVGDVNAQTGEIAGSAIFTGAAAIDASEVAIIAQIEDSEFVFAYWSTAAGEVEFRKLAGQDARLALAVRFDTTPAASITFGQTAAITFNNEFVRLEDTPKEIDPCMAVVGNPSGDGLLFTDSLAANTLYYYAALTTPVGAGGNTHDILAVISSGSGLEPLTATNAIEHLQSLTPQIGLIPRPSATAINATDKLRAKYIGVIKARLYEPNASQDGWQLSATLPVSSSSAAPVELVSSYGNVVLSVSPPATAISRQVGRVVGYEDRAQAIAIIAIDLPASVPQATDSKQGVMRFATDTEVSSRENVAAAVRPSSMLLPEPITLWSGSSLSAANMSISEGEWLDYFMLGVVADPNTENTDAVGGAYAMPGSLFNAGNRFYIGEREEHGYIERQTSTTFSYTAATRNFDIPYIVLFWGIKK